MSLDMISYEKFDEYFSGGDPGIKKLFLLRTIYPMLGLVGSYLLFVTLIGPLLMRERPPLQMRRLIVVYNAGLVAFYVYFLARGAFFIPELGFSFICGSLHDVESPIIPDVFHLGYQLYVVRFVELLDTVFLVLSKKSNMITPLHVFHHSIVPIFGWFGFRSESSGYLAVFMAINSSVHIIMYFYYAIAALGPEYKRYIWWKKYLTSLQILQFLFVTLYLVVISSIGCVQSRTTLVFSTFLTVLFFFLFIQYYLKAYNKRDPENNKKETVKNGTAHKNGIPTAYRNALKKAS